MDQHIAIYVRTSTARQDLRSQVADLERWVKAYADGEEVRWYKDQQSGTTMERPSWSRLEEAYRAGHVSKIVVWRTDRLGRTAAGLSKLYAELRSLQLPLVSIREGFDLMTPAGHLVGTILASVAQFETEVRKERQAAGIAAAKAAGKSWGGREKGNRWKVTDEMEEQMVRMFDRGKSIAAIARVHSVSRPTVYRILDEAGAR